MIRPVIAAAALVLGITTVLAQSDPIAERKKIMKANGDMTKVAAGMTKGEIPFDAAKAKEIFATYQDAAKKMPALFPDNSKTGGETSAAPAIWEDMAGFKAAFAKLDKDSADAAASTKDLGSFKAAFGAVTKNCGGCHEKFRIKKS